MSAPRRTGAGALTALAVLLTGCTVGAEPDAHVIPAEDVPYGLLSDGPEQPATTVPDGTTVTVHLVRDDELAAAERTLPPEGTLLDLLTVLAAGPDEDERRTGLSSPIPDTGAFESVEVVRGVAEVALGQGFSPLAGGDQVRAIGQVVLTLTGRPGVGRVAFTFDGDPVEAPRGDGSVTSEPLARDDFADLVAGP